MPELVQNSRRPRLEEAPPPPSFAPFIRAKQLTTIALYWLPVQQFPVPFRQRDWILHLLAALDAHFGSQELLPENFLQLKHTRTDLNRRFSQTLLDYNPITGVQLAPGKKLPEPPTALEIKDIVDNPDKNAEVRIDHLVPDYLVWFLEKKGAEQRGDFFGVGGMMCLWVKTDEKNAPAPIALPRSLATHPAMAGQNFDRQFRKLHSMRAPWLKRSKAVFGGDVADDPIGKHVPFILPELPASAFLAATEEQLEQWFGVFHGFVAESLVDKGLLFAVAEPDFDDTLGQIVQSVVSKHGTYKDL